MSNLDKLIYEITNDNLVKRFKELEQIIDSDQLLNENFKELLDLQKVMVRKGEKGSKGFNLAKKTYDDALKKVMNHVVLSEYLDLLEQVNFDLGLIQKIISDEISIDFE